MQIVCVNRMVQVEKCSYCVMVLGAVSTVMVINNCDNLTIIAACRSIHVRYAHRSCLDTILWFQRGGGWGQDVGYFIVGSIKLLASDL